MNLYAYVHNDPINFVDPLGLWGAYVGAGGGAGIGFGPGELGQGDHYGAGVYIGAQEGTMGHAELGGYSYHERTEVLGGDIGGGIEAGVYFTDSSEFFDGQMEVESYTVGIFGFEFTYDGNGDLAGFGVSVGGEGYGLAGHTGTSTSYDFPLQENLPRDQGSACSK